MPVVRRSSGSRSWLARFVPAAFREASATFGTHRRAGIRLATIWLVLAVVCVGCVPPEARRIVREQAVLQAEMVRCIERGEASQTDLIRSARANAQAWRQLDRLFNEGQGP